MALQPFFQLLALLITLGVILQYLFAPQLESIYGQSLLWSWPRHPLLLFVLLGLLFALHLRLMVVAPVRVNGSSMEPTLTHQQIHWMKRNSLTWQLPRLDYPFGSPWPAEWRSAMGADRPTWRGQWRQPQRGELLLFRYPGFAGQGSEYVKRLVALPGDSFLFRDGQLWINGEPEYNLAERSYRGMAPELFRELHETYPSDKVAALVEWQLPDRFEELPMEIRYSARFGLPRAGVVPKGAMIVLGDRRADSFDSRSIGFVPIQYTTGILIR